jgi:hypothetical protein
MANELTPPPSSPPGAPPSYDWLLQAILGNPFRVEGQWYNGQAVPLDGYTFVRCRFDNCNLITQKGSFAFEHCVIQGGFLFFNGESQKVVRLWNVGRFLQPIPSLQPVHNDDGTISIP